jgi:hypothetical protein
MNLTPPTITGLAQVGQTLTADPGTWSHNPASFAYQWTDMTTGPIPGATQKTYVPVEANLGHSLTVAVVASAPSAVASALDFSQPANSALLAAIGVG